MPDNNLVWSLPVSKNYDDYQAFRTRQMIDIIMMNHRKLSQSQFSVGFSRDPNIWSRTYQKASLNLRITVGWPSLEQSHTISIKQVSHCGGGSQQGLDVNSWPGAGNGSEYRRGYPQRKERLGAGRTQRIWEFFVVKQGVDKSLLEGKLPYLALALKGKWKWVEF